VVTNEGGVGFTRNGDPVYAIVTDAWQYAEPKTFTLKSVAMTDKTQLDVLGKRVRSLSAVRQSNRQRSGSKPLRA